MALSDCDALADNFSATDSTWTVPGASFSATLVTQTQADGQTASIPALKAVWSAATNAYVTGIEFKYTPTSFSGQEKHSAVQPVSTAAGGSWVTTDGIVSEGVYDCYWRASGPNGKVGDWVGPTSVTMESDPALQLQLSKRLWTIQPNIWKFSVFTATNGAAVVGNLTSGSQLDGFTIPGGSANIFVSRNGATYGLATTDGATYNFQARAWVDSGTAILKARFLDASNAAVTGLADQTFNLTTTPTVFEWEGIFSDDADFTTAKFQLFTAASGNIPAGRTVTLTDLMMETDDYWDVHRTTTPWRPAPGESNLARYTALLDTLFNVELGKTRHTVRTNALGNGEEYVPPGLTTLPRYAGSAITLGLTYRGQALICTHATNCNVTVPPKASVDWIRPGVITLVAYPGSTGTVTVVPGASVKIWPPYGGALVIPAGGSAQLLWMGARTYAAGEWLMLGNG